MAYFLGIDVGAVRTVAVVARSEPGDVETVDLGDDPDPDGVDRAERGPAGIASVLHLGADGVLTVGARAQRRTLTEPERVAAGFPGRIGDDAMLLAGEPWAPEELTAWLVRWVVDRVAEREGAPAAAIAVSHPASWDADRTRRLADAVAEQDLEVAFLAPARDDPRGDDPDVHDTGAATDRDGGGAARAVARALRAAASVTSPPVTAGPAGSAAPPVDGGGSGRHAAVRRGTGDAAAAREPGPEGSGPEGSGAGGSGTAGSGTEGSGRHLVVGGAIAALASAAEPGEEPGRHGATDEDPDDGDGSASSTHDPTAVDDRDDTADDNGTSGDPAGSADAAGDGEPERGWDVPAPRSPDSGAHPADPATANLVADLVGFTGGMGATNTAGLLSGYTPPQGMPASWATGHTAHTGTATATDSAVALPAQRSESGRWPTVAPADRAEAQDAAPVVAPRARQNPTVLVSAGGLAAAVAVVGTLFLWPAPRTTNSAERPVAAVPAATTTVDPTAPTVALTPTAEPTPVRRPRPAPPRTRRPVVPPVTEPPSATDSTEPPTDSTEPTESRTTAPSSTQPSTTTTTTTTKARNN